MLQLLLALGLSLGSDPAPAAERVLADETRTLPTLGRVLRDVRVLDESTGRILRRTTDAATGELVDGDRLLLREAEARDRASGKVSHELRERMDGARGSLPVVFWLVRDARRPDLRGVLEGATARGDAAADARRTALAAAERYTTTVTGPFTRRLAAGGHAVDYVDPYVPIVFTELGRADILRLAALPEVDQVYYAFPAWESEGPAATTFVAPNEWASPSARTDAVHRRGIDGAGVKVLVNDVGAVTTTNSNLPPIVSGNPSFAASHATAVAGIISSSHPQQTGAAPGLLELYDYWGTGDIAAPQAWSWGMSQGISFGNCSWWNFNKGSIVFLDRYFDFIIRNFGVMMFKSCGNQGNGDFTTTPCNGFNMTASGNAFDNDTHDWDDDGIYSGSSTRNPQPSDHEKPEVASYGTNIVSTNTSGGVGSVGTGTSYASPVTCGTAALLAQTDPVLAAKPEAVKASLMAGAWHNLHGAAPLSDYDGAGGIDAAASQALVQAGQYTTAIFTSATFAGGPWTHSFQLDAGNETRVVGLWFSVVDGAQTVDLLQMDLDMVVRGPGGGVVASSASTKNPFEIVSFVPPATGTYTVEMQKQRFNGETEPFALAWSTTFDLPTNTVTIGGSTKIGGTVTYDWFDRYHPGEAFVALLSFTPYPGTLAVPTSKLLPIGSDALLDLSLLLPGFQGNYDGAGRASASVPIPNLSGLVGLPIHNAVLTLQTGGAEVEEMSSIATFTITM